MMFVEQFHVGNVCRSVSHVWYGCAVIERDEFDMLCCSMSVVFAVASSMVVELLNCRVTFSNHSYEPLFGESWVCHRYWCHSNVMLSDHLVTYPHPPKLASALFMTVESYSNRVEPKGGGARGPCPLRNPDRV